MQDELEQRGWYLGPVVGTSDDGSLLHTVYFVRDGQIWTTVLTAEDAELERSIDWEGTPAEWVGVFERRPPFDPFRDYGMCDADFI